MIVKIKILLLLFIIALHNHSYCQATKSSKRQTVFIEDLTTFELSEKIKRGFTTVLIHSAGTEATGPHVALGKHNIRVRSYAQRIADSLGNALIAPILPFAPNSEALQKWPGTFTLDSLTFSKVNEQVAISMISSGFRHIIFLSDHFNSQAPLAALARKLDSMYHAQGIDVYYAADGYVKARAQIEAYIEKQHIVPGGHGGLWDVSETMAISKAYVRREFFVMGDTTNKGNGPLNAKGFSGDPTKATAKLGEQFAALRVRLYVDEIKRHLNSLGE
jgi:creatinine amidohydrolase